MSPYDIIGWLVILIFLLLVFIFANIFTTHEPKPTVEPLPLKMDINLTVNGLLWTVDAKWEYLKDRKMTEMALAELLNYVHEQEKA